MTLPILEVKNLVKRFNGFTAVSGISFSIPPGICFGLLGPNGAGKTTTLEVVEGIQPPTSGEILFKGSPVSDSFRQEVGIQFQQTALLDFLSVEEVITTFQSLYERTRPLEELISMCHLSDIRKRMNDKISGGQRQRLMLALALLNEPDLLFLDEPSTGLDPQARRNLWDIIGEVKASGKTIILTTHYMEEAQELCDDIAIMDHGEIIARGSSDELIRKNCEGTAVTLPAENIHFNPDDIPWPHAMVARRVEIYTNKVNECLRELIRLGADLSDMTVRSPNLEDVFLKLTGRELRA